MKNMRYNRKIYSVLMKIWIFIFLSFSANIAQAKSVKVNVLHSSQSVDLTKIHNVEMQPFAGNSGYDFSYDIGKRLSEVIIYNQPYFNIFEEVQATKIDASVVGFADYIVKEYHTYSHRKKCYEKDDKGKCIKHKKIKVACTARDISLHAQLSLLSRFDGGTLYSDRKSKHYHDEICEDEDYIRGLENIRISMVKDVAKSFIKDIVPYQDYVKVKFAKDNKNMDNGLRKEFKSILKLTKNNIIGGCDRFKQLSTQVKHAALQYNLGVCAEYKGNLFNALYFYQDSLLGIDKRERAEENIIRVKNHIAAQEEYDNRQQFIASR